MTTALIRRLLSTSWIIFGVLALAPIASAQEMRLHFIDVGQGNATLVEFPCAAMLIDTGGESNSEFDSTEALTAYLDSFFEQRPDLHKTFASLILTHAHIDHTRGVKEVLRRYHVLNAITNGHVTGSGKPGQIALQKKVADGEATVDDPSDDIGFVAAIEEDIPADKGLTNDVIDPIKCDSVDPEIRVLWGASSENPGWSAKDFANENDHSVVVRIDFGKASALFTGDLEESAIPSLVAHYAHSKLLDTDLYEVSHHGSKNGTTERLLDAITPKIAVISMGPPTRHTQWTAWAYGHPRRNIVEMLQEHVEQPDTPRQVMVADAVHKFSRMNISHAIYGTGWDGTIILRANVNGEWKREATGNSTADLRDPPENRVNLNTATLDELKSLPMIGATRAEAIIKYRTENGPFSTADDLMLVRGIGKGTLSAIRHLIVIKNLQEIPQQHTQRLRSH